MQGRRRQQPTGNRSAAERLDTEMETDENGFFTFHVGPSTRPYLSFKGEAEAYELAAVAAGLSTVRAVVVGRGEKADLGVLVVS